MLSKTSSSVHLAVARSHWEDLRHTLKSGRVVIDGSSLTIGDVVAASEHGCHPHLTRDVETLEGIKRSVETLHELLAEGHEIYGVNTGFGGSADSRTNHYASLQRALLQLLHSGILTKSDTGNDGTPYGHQSMPVQWVRAAMVVRSNSLSRGHSAVSIDCIEAILRLVRLNITPIVPLRGTISASGDLMPLAYIAGVIQGNPGVYAHCGNGRVLTGQQVSELLAIPQVTLGPKEGLGLVNGTASSAALASLAMYKSHHLAVISQVATALTVEALQGSADSFHPFISSIRPHNGQIEAASNIHAALQGSRLARLESKSKAGLVQDRYSLRTASQWIGPQLEDLLLADHQVSVELNSTTDNPLIDTETRDYYCGGNFQATSVTSAMEKTRLALQMLGKLLYTQCSETIDPSLNNGLPANLAADDPSLSFTMKGVDISMASYMSELAYVANPVSSHVQTAEMHNQAVNSLAFVSARYTMQAVDLVTMMSACALYVACQALDLRVLQLTFLDQLPAILTETTKSAFGGAVTPEQTETLATQLATSIKNAWPGTSRMDLHGRCTKVVKLANSVLMESFTPMATSPTAAHPLLTNMPRWEKATVESLESTYNATRNEFFKNQTTASYLGVGAKVIYRAIREDLNVPFHRGFVEQPSADGDLESNRMNGREKKVTGGWVSVIFEALCDGRLSGAVLDALQAKGDNVANGCV
ncbi:phenylalanine ammonia-lyase [Aspergillus carlsbadensis]|nr:phenylalanine ammonia-lyase [Aspergillus carlsbadensis]